MKRIREGVYCAFGYLQECDGEEEGDEEADPELEGFTVADGYLSDDEIRAMNARMDDLLEGAGLADATDLQGPFRFVSALSAPLVYCS